MQRVAAKALVGVCAMAMLAALTPQAFAQSQSGRQIKMVRAVSARWGDQLDGPHLRAAPRRHRRADLPIIENKPGAGSAIGNTQVARAPTDGNTMLLASPALVITAALRSGLPYDPRTSFEPVCSSPTARRCSPSRPPRPTRPPRS